MNTEIIDAGRDVSGGYKVDVSRGTNVDRVSSEWFSRPDDERYLSLDDLFASVKGRAERSRTRTVESAAIRVEAHRDNPEKLGLLLPGTDEPIAPKHWSYGQLSSLVGAPAAYLRQLPAPLAGINIQYGLTNHRAEQIKTMEVTDDPAGASIVIMLRSRKLYGMANAVEDLVAQGAPAFEAATPMLSQLLKPETPWRRKRPLERPARWPRCSPRSTWSS